MRMLVSMGVMAMVITTAAGAAAQPVGTFKVEGQNPGASGGPPAYTGVVTITRVGDVYHVVWTVGASKARVEGRGLFDSGVLAVTYPNPQPPGPALVLYTKQGKGWLGRWIIPGVERPGTEILTPSP